MSELAVPDAEMLAKYSHLAPTAEESSHLEGGGGDGVSFNWLKVLRESAQFEDNEGETFKKIVGVVVLEKPQRAAFMPNDMSADSKVCTAPDGKIGNPNYDNFPRGEIEVQGLKKGAPNRVIPTHPDYGKTELACADCALSQWGSHPENSRPWCQQQSSVVVASADENGEPIAHIIKFSPGALKHIGKFKKPFQTQRLPLFSQIVEITLDKIKTDNGITYSVPKFTLKGPTDLEDWEGYAALKEDAENYLNYRPKQDAVEATVEVVGSTSNDAPSSIEEAFPGATVTDVEIEL